MRKLVVIEFLSLDGVMQSLGSPDEDTSGGFKHGGWSAPYFDEVLGTSAGEGLKSTDAYLFGRRTYEKMAAYWPFAPADDPMAAHLNATPKYVATNTLTDLSWQHSSVIDGDAVDGVRKLKEEPGGNIAVLGSGELVQDLIENDLVDEFRLFVHPLVIGSGKTLFRQADEMRPLRLIDAKPTTTGVLILGYEPA